MFSILVLLILICNCQARIELPKDVIIPAVLLFGDSIVDQGNNNHIKTLAKCDFAPYGKDFQGGKPTGRFSNGKTPSDLMAEKLGIKEYTPAYLDPELQDNELLTGVSFASGGAGYDPLTSKTASAWSLSDQLNMYKAYIRKLKELVGNERTNFILANSLHTVVAGSNDLANNYYIDPVLRIAFDINSYTDFMARKATKFVKDLYKLGARRILVMGVPPLGCVPSQRTLAGGTSRDCKDEYNYATEMFNSKLSNAFKSHTNDSSDAKARFIYADSYNLVLDLIQNHDKYGFTIVDKGCCGTGLIEVIFLCNKFAGSCSNDSSYLFWDSFHPTERGYNILVDRILQENIKYFY